MTLILAMNAPNAICKSADYPVTDAVRNIVCDTVKRPFAVALMGAVVSVSVALAGPAHALNDQQIKFMADVNQHGGLTADQVSAPGDRTLGDAVCADLFNGNAAANEVIHLSDDVDSLQGSISKAEVAVYWAITDLCPDQMSQRQDAWRDGQ
jgi:hypothetical protein